MPPPRFKTDHPPRPRSGCALGPCATSRPAFTLIEVLVVVAIITLLMGIGGAVWANAREAAKASTVRVALGQLAGVSTEYIVQTGGLAATYAGGYSTTPTSDTGSIADFITAVKDNARPAYDLLQTVNEGLVVDTDNDGELDEIVDVWGTPLRYYPGTSNGSGDETANGLYERQQPYFASAGPDQTWGSINRNANTPDEAAEDNLYSFEID